MVYDFEEFVNEGKQVDFVIVVDDGDYEEGFEFIDRDGDNTKVDETEIKRIWDKMKGDVDKFAEAVFAKYPDVFQINHSDSAHEEVGDYIDRETGKWYGFFG